jgi:hypothetical protein
VRRTAARTAEGASAVADSIGSAYSNVSICGRREVTRVLEADLQHFLKREGIAFINERHKVTVGALMARRLRKMKHQEYGKSVNLREKHWFDSSKLGERFIEASHVLGEHSRGVILERQALLKAAHNKLVCDSCARTRKLSEN